MYSSFPSRSAWTRTGSCARSGFAFTTRADLHSGRSANREAASSAATNAGMWPAAPGGFTAPCSSRSAHTRSRIDCLAWSTSSITLLTLSRCSSRHEAQEPIVYLLNLRFRTPRTQLASGRKDNVETATSARALQYVDCVVCGCRDLLQLALADDREAQVSKHKRADLL